MSGLFPMFFNSGFSFILKILWRLNNHAGHCHFFVTVHTLKQLNDITWLK